LLEGETSRFTKRNKSFSNRSGSEGYDAQYLRTNVLAPGRLADILPCERENSSGRKNAKEKSSEFPR